MKNKTAIQYLIGAMVLAMGSSVYADVYNLAGNQGSSQDWNTLGDWVNTVGGAHPAAILPTDDYDMNGFVLRGPTSANPTFDGKSLTSSGGPLLFKHTGTATINSFIDNGGAELINGQGGTQGVHLVNFALNGWTRLEADPGRGLDLQIDNWTGSATLRTGNSTSQTGYYGLTVTGASGFSGTIQSTFGTTDWKNDADLSNATYEIVTAGYEDVILNSDITVGSLLIGSTTYGPGSYSFATLNAAHDSSFVDGGTGSITVIPEPATLGLIGLSTAGLVVVRRFFSL